MSNMQALKRLGAVAQHFKNDMIVDKIRVQMDAFLEDGPHEAIISVIRALVVVVPHTTDRFRDYLLSKISQLTANPLPSSYVMRRRDRANAFCESIRALDATGLFIWKKKFVFGYAHKTMVIYVCWRSTYIIKLSYAY